jgi:4-amino-4-deoxy-L-arabinose transferase-like glycosyltransferase
MRSISATGHKISLAVLADRLPALVLSVATLFTLIVLASIFETTLIAPDTIQLIDAARRLLAGEGFVSGIIFYESQMEFGYAPAPLTVWPPGFSWLLAAAMYVGVPAAAAAFAICLLAHVATAALIYVGLRRAAVSGWIAVIAALVWLLHASAWSTVLACNSEPLFIALTLASGLALVEVIRGSRRSRMWLAVASVCAAFAVLTRYTGVLWPAAAGLWLLIRAIRMRSWQPIRVATMFAALPALVTLGMFWRNWQLSSRLSGGQFEFNGAGTIRDVLRHMYWESDLLVGHLLTSRPALLAIIVVLLFIACVRIAARTRSTGPRAAILGASFASIVVLAAFLFVNAHQFSIIFVEFRYWLPAMPFLLLVLGIVVEEAVKQLRHARGQLLWPTVILACAWAGVLSAAAELPGRWPIAPVHPSTAIIQEALHERLADGRALHDVLVAPSDSQRLILANAEHRLSFATGRAIVGLTDSRYTKTVWDKEEVAALVERFKIERLVFFPTAYDPKSPLNSNNVFFDELQRQQVPPWLVVRLATDSVVLYDVVASELPRGARQ